MADMTEYPMATLHNLARFTRLMRRHRGWTQAQLAAEAATTQSWVSRLERGHPRADIDVVLRTFHAMGATARLRRFDDPFAYLSGHSDDRFDSADPPAT